MKKNTFKLLSLLLSVTLFLAACKTEVTETPPLVVNESTAIALTVSALNPSNGETDIATPEPEARETPSITGLDLIQAEILLWVPQGADHTLAQSLDTQLQTYSALNELSYERRESFAGTQLADTTRLVISLASEAETRAMAEVKSQTQFLAFLNTETSPLSNMHIISQTQGLPEQQSFLAGLILAMTTPDYRIGVISQGGSSEGEIAKSGFVTGARFFCGLCNARYTPVIYYPIVAEMEDPSGFQAALDTLLAQSVTAVFVQPGLSSPEVIAMINAKGLAIVGVEGQAGIDGAQDLVALISSGATGDIIPFVERVLAGESLEIVHAGLDITRVNEEKLTPGKRLLFERYKEELLNGEIKALPHGQ